MIVLWGVVGLAAGAGVHVANGRLARWEGLRPAPPRWHLPASILLAGMLFGLLGWQLGFGWQLLVRSLWVAVLLHVACFDFEHRLVLDLVLAPAGALAFLASLLLPGTGPGWQSALVAGLGAGAVFAAAALFGRVLFEADVMGLGDVKLAAFIGLVLGARAVATALLAGVVLAGIAALALVVLRLRGLRDSMAYGPYLAAGALLGLFLLGAPRS
ncbi:MAG: prepilin peptidase [Candidatus Dormibacteraeota bacterium]|nr:prepilin peptidase [Candidatus Dormibacteraeota bacterium]MBO0762527.1 prepilin peptidase [Candidatus Dormibacteraeota bacterium]